MLKPVAIKANNALKNAFEREEKKTSKMYVSAINDEKPINNMKSIKSANESGTLDL